MTEGVPITSTTIGGNVLALTDGEHRGLVPQELACAVDSLKRDLAMRGESNQS